MKKPALPFSLQELEGYFGFSIQSMEEITGGCSMSSVYRIQGDQTSILKLSHLDHQENLGQEAEVIRWLGDYTSVPEALFYGQVAGYELLHLSLIEGDCASDLPDPRAVVRAYARGLKRLHSIPVGDCPFDGRLESRISAARERVEKNLVDEADFDEERQGQSAIQVLTEVDRKYLDLEEDPVVCHGDYCLPNLILKQDYSFSGFIDLSRAGVSDRFQDLALAHRSILANFGFEYSQMFFQEYGIKPDDSKIAFYCLLDELF